MCVMCDDIYLEEMGRVFLSLTCNVLTQTRTSQSCDCLVRSPDCQVMSLDCLVLSADCLVMSLDCLVMSADCLMLSLANGVRHTPPDFTPYQMKSGHLCCIPYPRDQDLPVLICQPDPVA